MKNRKSPFLAVIMSLMWPGLGMVYAENYGWGFFWMLISAPMLFILSLFGYKAFLIGVFYILILILTVVRSFDDVELSNTKNNQRHLPIPKAWARILDKLISSYVVVDKEKKPYITTILNFILPGLGYLYLGRPLVGVMWFLPILVGPVIFTTLKYALVFLAPLFIWLLYWFYLIYAAICCITSFNDTVEHNKQIALKEYSFNRKLMNESYRNWMGRDKTKSDDNQ